MRSAAAKIKFFSLKIPLILVLILPAMLSHGTMAADQKKAMIGVDDWLIYTDKKDFGNLLDYKKTGVLEEATLNIRGMRLDRMSNWLMQKGIIFILTVAPNTPTVYPESVPKHVKVIGSESRLDQIARYLKEKTKVKFLDLRPALIEAKKEWTVYYKTDTHWNELGAFIVYQAIIRYMQEVHPASSQKLLPMQLSEFNLDWKDFSGDLARMLGLQNTLKEKVPVIKPKTPFTAIQTWSKDKSIATLNKKSCPGLSLLVFKDSFFDSVQPYLAEHFCEARFIESLGIDKLTIEVMKPDIVVWEISERYLGFIKNVPDTP